MRSSRSRCALAGAFLLAAAGVFASPAHARAQGGFDRGVVAAADQVVNLIAQSANSRQNRADLGELRSALDQLLNVLEQPRSGQGDPGRHDERRGHLRHGLASAGHDRRHDDADKDHADKKRSEGKDRHDDDKAAHKNRIGAMPGQPAQTANAKARPRTASGVGEAGHAKNGGGAGAAEARPVRTLAPAGQDAGQQMNPPGAAKNGAGPGNVQAKNGASGKFGNNNGNANQALGNDAGANRFGNAKAGNQAGGAPMNNQGNPNGKPWQFGDRKDDHHHHHFGEARDAGDKRFGHDRQGQAMGGFGNAKNGAGPQANQVRAKNGSGANNAGGFAKNHPNRGNGQAMNNAGQNANASRGAGNNQANNHTAAKNNATQAYVNMLMHTNGARAGQQTHQSPGNSGRQQATQHSAGSSMTRCLQSPANSAHVHAGNSVGQHSASHPAHSGKK